MCTQNKTLVWNGTKSINHTTNGTNYGTQLIDNL